MAELSSWTLPNGPGYRSRRVPSRRPWTGRQRTSGLVPRFTRFPVGQRVPDLAQAIGHSTTWGVISTRARTGSVAFSVS